MSEIDTRHFLFKFKIDFSQLKDNIKTIPGHLFRITINTAGNTCSFSRNPHGASYKEKKTQNDLEKKTIPVSLS